MAGMSTVAKSQMMNPKKNSKRGVRILITTGKCRLAGNQDFSMRSRRDIFSLPEKSIVFYQIIRLLKSGDCIGSPSSPLG